MKNVSTRIPQWKWEKARTLLHLNHKDRDIAIQLGISRQTVSKLRFRLIIDAVTASHVQMKVVVPKELYWKTEQEIFDSINPVYTYESLSESEKEIYHNL